MQIVSISDTHGYLLQNLPKGDTLTISGDICPVRGSHSPIVQHLWLINSFFPWCISLIDQKIYKNIVFTPGNHDFVFQKNKSIKFPKHVHCLIDSSVKIKGIKFYGTPWSNQFCNWAFMAEENKLDSKFKKIPEGIDVLLCHGPAFGFGDKVQEYNSMISVGSKSLLKHVLRTSPKYLCVGHIHSGNHNPMIIESILGTTSINVSMVDENYDISYPPFEFEV